MKIGEVNDRAHKGESDRDDKNLSLLAVITHYFLSLSKNIF
jgi:hypothetical protein